jgi:hypothetical protein
MGASVTSWDVVNEIVGDSVTNGMVRPCISRHRRHRHSHAPIDRVAVCEEQERVPGDEQREQRRLAARD